MVEVLEGNWEEVLKRGSELEGQRVRLEVLPPLNGGTDDPAATGTLAGLAALEAFTPTEEEREILDGFEDLRREMIYSTTTVRRSTTRISTTRYIALLAVRS
jgi:hypothetical protein